MRAIGDALQGSGAVLVLGWRQRRLARAAARGSALGAGSWICGCHMRRRGLRLGGWFFHRADQVIELGAHGW